VKMASAQWGTDAHQIGSVVKAIDEAGTDNNLPNIILDLLLWPFPTVNEGRPVLQCKAS
jgi:hypothetical protein